MIKSVVLKNFRGFRDHTIDFTPFCLLIGQNNAGKTTLIEALRIASAALMKAPSAHFIMAPDNFVPEVTGPLFKFSVETIDIEHRGIHYNYESSDPAIIKIRYNNNCSITIAIGPEIGDTYCQLMLPGGKKVNSRNMFNKTKFRSIFVMPPVGALLAEETQRDKKYLYRHLNGYLSYRHIRNQMADMPAEFERFRDFLIETWSSKLQVSDIEYGSGDQQNLFTLIIRDGPFVSEVALVGSGLQAWIQTIWFLSRVDADSIVVLDEPDVYLHADLQKKLIKLLCAERYRQTIVATHSMEMIADVSPIEIVSVAKRSPRSRPLSSSAEAQSVVEAIGTNLNIQLSKLASTGKIIFVEGKDYAFIDQIAFKFGNEFYDKFSKLAHFSVGGMNNWPKAAMATKALYELSLGKVRGTMFLDRDYKDDKTFEDIIDTASKESLDVKIWSKKEIENYFISPDLIHSYIGNRAREEVSLEDVRSIIEDVVEDMTLTLPDLVADSYQAADRRLALTTAMARAREYVAKKRHEGAAWEDLICGKKALSAISGRSQERWGVQIAPMSLCRHVKLEDLASDLSDAVRELLP